MPAHLPHAIDAAQQLLTRSDNKASLLLALDGALLAFTASAADPGLPAPARAAGALALVAFAAAGVLLLLAVRPRGADGITAARLLAEARGDDDGGRLDFLTGAIRAKYRRICRAVDCLLTGGAFLAVAAAAAAAVLPHP